MQKTNIILSLLDISPFQWSHIATALFCGILIGFERQLRAKPVGIRTASLIVIGTYLFLKSSFMLQNVEDQSRVIGQVITGIGFLGAGVMLSLNGMVLGVTSAATIWILAAIGVMIGTDHLLPAIKLSVLTVTILFSVDIIEKRINKLTRGIHSR